MEIPFHLKKYIVEQNPAQYTPIEQASWRFILRQLKNYLSQNAHPFYLEGLRKTGISVEEIPSIQKISEHLKEFGWQAVPVSGFIPPAAFLELQAYKILPIASDMRTLSHLMYTPAPDIVHEAAGHAPMVAHPEFRSYLEMYGQVARKAIINKQDLDLYNAIRELSDIKEHPNSTPEQISDAQKKLERAYQNMGEPSEASLLSRMGWWTTEYGLIGNPPKIYGAGLLSSLGESKTALEAKVQKIPISLDCIKYSYDITEPQPQLFVTPDFQTLKNILEEFSRTMAYKRGGIYGLDLILKAQTVNSIELSSGIQISGKFKEYKSKADKVFFVKFEGPSQLSYKDQELPNQGRSRHSHGYSSPIGRIQGSMKCLSQMNEAELSRFGLKIGSQTTLNWESGIQLKGKLTSKIQKEGLHLVLTFTDCIVSYKNEILFQPEWGEFDLALGLDVTSAFGGAADKQKYGDFEDFQSLKTPAKIYSDQEHQLFKLYQSARELRKDPSKITSEKLESILTSLKNYPKDWLLKLEVLELGKYIKPSPSWIADLEKEIYQYAKSNPDMGYFIEEGIKLSDRLFI
jgi:phenylalanine-4-hydroxylase